MFKPNNEWSEWKNKHIWRSQSQISESRRNELTILRWKLEMLEYRERTEEVIKKINVIKGKIKILE